MATINVRNGPTVIMLQEVVIGSLLSIAVAITEESAPDVFTPMDLTGMTVLAHIKDNPRLDVAPDFEFVVTKRDQVTERGWVNLVLDGTVTGVMAERQYQASVKVFETGSAELGTTVAVIVLPTKFRATR